MNTPGPNERILRTDFTEGGVRWDSETEIIEPKNGMGPLKNAYESNTPSVVTPEPVTPEHIETGPVFEAIDEILAEASVELA